MQVIAISNPSNEVEARLMAEHHKLRADVFYSRLGWDVDVTEGLETDRFDRLRPTYILAVSDDEHVVGCARLLPLTGPTMICDVFPTLVETGVFRPHAAMVESSRFCVDPQLKEEGAERSVRDITRMMFAAIIEWSITSGFHEIVTVTDLRLERILSRVGWPLQRLGPPREIGVTMAVAGILPADASTLATVRPPAYRTYVTTLSGHPA